PKSVFEYFAKLCNIPHGSGNEKQVSEFIAETLRPYCKEVKVYQDGTVYAYKEATPGYEDRKTVCLQGHMDMVCVKTKLSNHDFKKDPLDLYVEDG
ncbi:MAG: hypothetical protein K2M43_03220, partial [Mycoplasmoidaceae bacterium]|nr:hypothetical protein [Mycoplasmoidaceae bacterium]